MLLCDSVSVVMHLCCHVHSYLFFSFSLFKQFNVDKQLYWGTFCLLANKMVIMSICTNNWESVMNLNNRMLNIDYKNQERKIKNEKNR